MPAAKTDIRIAILGGGGRYWATSVLMDLALCSRLTGEVRLHDLKKPDANAALGRKLFKHPKSRTDFAIRSTASLKQALSGADVVVIGIAPGPGSMFANDLEITAAYGITHTVGDTTGPAGISRCLRAIPIHAGFADAIARHAPEAWVINYTNPMTVCTATLHAVFPGIKAFGCCHEVYGTQKLLADLVKQHHGIKRPPRAEILMDVAGVNHFTFATAARFRGQDLFPLLDAHMRGKGFFADASDYARRNRASGAFWDHRALVAFDYYRRFGALGAAGDRHLVEFVPWYLAGGEEALHRWGVCATPATFRAGTWEPEPGMRRAPSPLDHGDVLATGPRPSGEEGIAQVCALLGLTDLDTNVNLPNRGQLPDLPLGAIVETNAQFRQNAVNPVVPRPLPTGLKPLVQRVVETQLTTLEAGLTKDFDLALEAILLDPLCHLDTDRAATMLRELIRANQPLMEGWKV